MFSKNMYAKEVSSIFCWRTEEKEQTEPEKLCFFLNKMDEEEEEKIKEDVRFFYNNIDVTAREILEGGGMVVVAGMTGSGGMASAMITHSFIAGISTFLTIALTATAGAVGAVGLGTLTYFAGKEYAKREKSQQASKKISERRVQRLSTKVKSLCERIEILEKKKQTVTIIEEIAQLTHAREFFSTKKEKGEKIKNLLTFVEDLNKNPHKYVPPRKV